MQIDRPQHCKPTAVGFMALRLNLGSAGRVLAGYKQEHLNPGPGVDLVLDISRLDGISDNSVVEK